MRTNTGEEWLQERVRKYGPISKLSLFGKPTVFIHGQAANKLVFSGDSSKIANKQTSSIRAILGDRNLMELIGQDHKRVRDSLMSFLRPESLKQYVGNMDGEVRKHIELHWQGKEKVAALPMMKNLTFNIICSLLFGMEERAEREKFLQSFQEMIEGMWSIPVKLPFTRYNRSLRASSKVQDLLKELVREKKAKLEQHTASPHQDLITCLLSKRDEENKRVVTDKEILHNIMLIMVAGHDTSSVLITFMLRLLSKNPAIYKAVLQEQEEVAKSKILGEPLTWEDLARMRYTWRVAMETLRMVPPVFGGFRVAIKDIDYGGYLIPKGWQDTSRPIFHCLFPKSHLHFHFLFFTFFFFALSHGFVAGVCSTLITVLFLLSWRRRGSSRKLPPGSLGIPIIGQSFGLLRALRTNTVDEWLHERVRKYGPISKLTLFGKPTVFIHGQAANKLVFCGDSSKIASKQTSSTRAILGDRNLMELTGQDHKRVRDSIVSFLRPESLKQYVGKMDEEVRKHIELHWQGKEKVAVLPLMKNLTFNIICSLLFGMEERAERDKFLQSFEEMMKGMLSIPVKLPFMRYNRSLRASSRVQALLKEVVQEKKVKLEQHTATPHQDLITCLLSKRNEENERVMTDKEILHNIMAVMVAGYDTSSILITFVLRLLSKNPAVYKAVLQEQEEITKSKTSGEPLTWEDLARMKYTWRVAMETLRMVPPVFGGFRVALKDIDYGGYIIPKGWQIFWASNMTHIDESIFPEPSKFDSARFENQKSVPPYSFVAFGGGPHVCPRNEFARIETLAAIHYLVTQYSWELCSDDHYIFDPMPALTEGLLLRIVAKIQK
ncbi:hypothetical protein NL676_024314 [Syzygium grande]|nr:hypothetical protein NL676_024314 [Syzygium grande]